MIVVKKRAYERYIVNAANAFNVSNQCECFLVFDLNLDTALVHMRTATKLNCCVWLNLKYTC